MTRNRLLIGITAALLVVTAVYWWQRTLKPHGHDRLAGADASSESSSGATVRPVGTFAIPLPAFRSKEDMAGEILSSLNHKPIEFYGRVIDQYGMPVADAEVRGFVMYNTGSTMGVMKPKAVTDANGLFSFGGFSGKSLDFNIIKPGYEFMPEGDAYHYTHFVEEEKRHQPNRASPVVQKMWKLQGPEPLIHTLENYRLSSDGSPVHIDLVTGKTVPSGGDLIVSLTHQIKRENIQLDRYDWEAKIEVVDGGLIEVNEAVTNMFLAPEDGYVSSILVKMPEAREDWTSIYKKAFYIRSRGKLYSRIDFEMQTIPSNKESYVGIVSWQNPSGSRNLEYDPAKRLYPKERRDWNQ
ncbi:MAG: carboxypeptidase-like regulatory domain-containing protein [Verrucomicrobiota bacterium]